MPDLVPDQESERWLRELAGPCAVRKASIDALNELLLRVARSEAVSWRARLPERCFDEVDDLCVQAASDAVMTILHKLGTFRGLSRFTTWACRFVLFEVSARLRRHAREQRRLVADDAVWALVPDSTPLAFDTLHQKRVHLALDRAVGEQLTDLQRLVFRAAILDDIPIDALATQLGSSRAAIYKVLHDARNRLRRTLVKEGLVVRTTKARGRQNAAALLGCLQ